MPLFDLPLCELKTYSGSNPCPEDFDTFWDQARDEMHSVDPDVTLQPAAFEVPFAECFDLYFNGVRGARIHAQYLRPAGRVEPHPAILQFHGYGGSAGDWSNKLSFVALGFSVAALDCRGQGGKSEDMGKVKGTTFKGHFIRGLADEPENLLFRQIFLDTAQLAAIVMDFPEVAEDRVGAMGGSQGGGLTLACASLESRLKRAVPIVPFLCDYKRVWELDLAENAYAELREFFRLFDPTHMHESDIFNKLGYIDVQHLVKRLGAEIFMGVGLMDQTCPPSTQFAAYNKIRSKKEMMIYHDFGHEVLPGFADKTFQFLADL